MTEARQRGWSVIEMSVVLAVIGLLAWSGLGTVETGMAQRDRDQAQQQAQAWRDRLRAYALNNRRLPCPDLTGQGWEGDASGACGTAMAGWLPYRALGLDLPAQEFRAAYAVFRAPNAAQPEQDADLAVRRERTGDAAGVVGFQDVFDLVRALNRATEAAAAAPAGVLVGQPHVTGDAARTGVADCAALPRDNVAFRILVPLKDRSGSGSRFDGTHSRDALCTEAPGSPMRHDMDDVVVTEGFASLAGWLQSRAW